MKFSYALIFASLLYLSVAKLTRAQEIPSSNQPAKLADLLAEAERSNPQIQAARHGWDAAKQVPPQASTLPDPQFVLQHVSVGSPRPFAGYTNSDFAYVGLGDRKSTRLNSSHANISYAVFWLKKKTSPYGIARTGQYTADATSPEPGAGAGESAPLEHERP